MIPHWIFDIGFFALLFFVLVFVHELGHFLMAKWVGIRVERFAIGMGPAIVSFKKGDTEYMIGLLPLGGYVKMAGDDPSKEYNAEEKKVGFLSKTPPQKLLVVFGGPVFNLLLPILLFSLMLITGIPNVDPVVGTMESGRPAELSGLLSGDRIKAIDGSPIKRFQDIEKFVEQSEGKTLQFSIERMKSDTGAAEELVVPVTPAYVPTKSKFGEDIEAYRLGVSPNYEVAQIFYDTEESIAFQSGLRRFDRVRAIGPSTIVTNDQFLRVVETLQPGSHTVVVERGSEFLNFEMVVPVGKGPVVDRLGLKSTELVVGRVEPESPAAQAGLVAEDRLVAINGKQMKHFGLLAEEIKSSQGKPVKITWNRNGREMSATLQAKATTIDDPIMGKDNPMAREPVFRIGVSSAKMLDTELSMERSWNPIVLLGRGLSESWNMMSTTVQALYKLFTGQLSLKLLGSPIMIYKVAGNSYRVAGGGYMGWISFLSNLALLSITLGLVNLLPIPVLDGGHATFFLIEWVRRKPISLRVMEIAMQIGIFILIALFGLVLVNDINRYQLFEPVLRLFR